MKLRYRLIISFAVIMVIPLALYEVIIYNQSRDGKDWQMPIHMPEYRLEDRTVDVFVSVLLILTLTSMLLIFWIYQGVIRKIEILVMGAEKIKEGDLDFSISIQGNDELSEVGVAFEEMRLRLREDAKKRLEAERNQRQLVSNIAHDLRTPLTAIKGYSEGLIDGVADTPDKQKSYLTTIHNKAEEMDVLLDELTAYSRLDTNRIPYNFKRLNVQAYFRELSDELRIDLDNKGARLVFYNYVEKDALFVADYSQITRVFHNCVANSVKYAKKDEILTIHFGVWSGDDFIHIEIKDNGIGISEKDLPHIFERLYRGDASRTSTGGSGIGLSIVKKIVEDHGGSVRAMSRLGEGTTISFVLKKILVVGG